MTRSNTMQTDLLNEWALNGCKVIIFLEKRGLIGPVSSGTMLFSKFFLPVNFRRSSEFLSALTKMSFSYLNTSRIFMETIDGICKH